MSLEGNDAEAGRLNFGVWQLSLAKHILNLGVFQSTMITFVHCKQYFGGLRNRCVVDVSGGCVGDRGGCAPA